MVLIMTWCNDIAAGIEVASLLALRRERGNMKE